MHHIWNAAKNMLHSVNNKCKTQITVINIPPMKKLLFLLAVCLCSAGAHAQKSVKANFRLDFYMNEPKAEFLVYVPDTTSFDGASVTLTSPSGQTFSAPAPKGKITAVEVPISALPTSESTFRYSVEGASQSAAGQVTLKKLPYKFNATQVDRKTQGVVSRGMPVIPFGFYCYSPVQPMIAEEEVVRGFNLLSPYQNIPRTDIKARKIYMDRAAELGMKVNYNLLSVATGGTGYNKNQNPEERTEMLRREVEMFKDHPALLSWYLADEPDGRKTPPEDIVELYDIIKEIDPYHPVTIVFMHRGTARKYADGLDIAMGDLYPVPRAPLKGVSAFQDELSREFMLEKAIWLVPQAFGGNEWWTREPTAAEMRGATYMGLINGSRGFQYFIRHGQNGFPKSTTAWAEAGAMALEIAELSPYVLSGEDAPEVSIADSLAEARAWTRGGNTVIAVVNQENKPKDISVKIEGSDYSGPVSVPFEDRVVMAENGVITDKMLGYDSKVYKITQKAPATYGDPENVVVDPDFEQNTSVGVPNAIYAQVGTGRGSTYFTDSRTAYSGEHSLRLTTHKNGEGVTLQHFPMIVDSGRVYTISFWAKAAPKEEFPTTKNYLNKRGKVKTEKIKPEEPVLHVNLRHLGKNLVDTDVTIDNPQWTRYTIDVPVEKQPGRGRDGITLNLNLKTRSMIWIDLVEFAPKK
ncbi:MAG: hypothetical protein DBY00_04910 [Flavobacteriales bacterium]|nr:MAG: hypothetical protein DBY00_04910 [Flavobacteriales bacterium]